MARLVKRIAPVLELLVVVIDLPEKLIATQYKTAKVMLTVRIIVFTEVIKVPYRKHHIIDAQAGSYARRKYVVRWILSTERVV